MSLEVKPAGWITDIRGNLVAPDPNLSKYLYLSREKALWYLVLGYSGNMMTVRFNQGDKINCRLATTKEDVKGEVLGYVAKAKEGIQIAVETEGGIKFISTNDIASYTL